MLTGETRFDRMERTGWIDMGRIHSARVLVAGAGALGNETVKNLVLAGFRDISVADFDTVEESNLSRCVLFRERHIGRNKAEVIAESAFDIDPQCGVTALPERIQSLDLSGYQPLLEQSAQNFYNGLIATQGATAGLNIDGVALTADICGFSCELNGEAYFIVVGTVIRAVQMTSAIMQPIGGTLSETDVIWSPLCTYMLASPASEFETVFPAFEAFMENTTISDQFYRANQKLADELRNIVVQSRGGYIDTILKNYTSEDDTYDEERFTDYIFDQNDYTLSDGTHVKIPTSYDYVYEGDNNVVYFSDSAFPEPGTQLSPNR